MKRHGALCAGVLSAWIALAACGKKEPPIQADPRPTAAPSGAASAEPTASAASLAPVVKAPVQARVASADLPLSIHAKEFNKHIFAVGGRMVVTPEFAVIEDGKPNAPKEGFSLEDFPGEDAVGTTTTPWQMTPMLLMGRYPDDLWLYAAATFGHPMPRSNQYVADRTYMYQRQYGRWGRVKDSPVAASPWSNGRTLAYLDTGAFKLAKPAKGKLAELPRQAEGKTRDVRVRGLAMTALATGEVLLLGHDRDDAERLVLERWDKDSLGASRLVPLPAPTGARALRAWVFAGDKAVLTLAALGDGVFAAAVEGDKASPIALPVKKLAEAHMAADGTLFVSGDGELYRYEGVHDGADLFTRCTPPQSMKAARTNGLFAESRATVYFAMETDKPRAGYILSSLPAPAGAPSAGAVGSASASGDDLLDAFPAVAAECKTPFVVLFAVTKSTSKTFTFPQTRRILAEFPDRAKVKILDFQHKGERFVGVVAPDGTTAEALAKHWNERDDKSKCRLSCFAPPEDAREVKTE